MFKKWISLLLIVSLVLITVACGANNSTSIYEGDNAETIDNDPDETNADADTDMFEEAETVSEANEEVFTAISSGLVPDEIQDNYAETITFRQYTEMLTYLVQIWDEDKLDEWKEISSAAAESDDEMRREDGILEIAYVMILLGVDTPSDFGDADADAVTNSIDAYAKVSWDYPLFPTWENSVFSWCNSNYMWGGLQTCAIKQSLVTGLAIYPFEPDGDENYLQNPLTREDAICAVLRLAQTDPAVLEPEAVYVSLSDVGAYSKDIITDELLAKESSLPEVTQQSLPSDWKGAGLSANKDGTHVYRDFSESDIAFLAENGFNFTRVFFSLSTLRFPDYPDDATLVNLNELEDLDQLIAWGIEYGVHIQISASAYLDESGSDIEEGTATTDAEWALYCEYWEMLTERYAGIPSKYLSFDLSNEQEPTSTDDVAAAGEGLQTVVDAIRSKDDGRVLLYSFQGNPLMEWVEKTASLGLAIGCHPYYPQYLTTSGFTYVEEENPYAEPSWPQIWLPGEQIANGTPLVLTGAVSGCKLSIHIGKSGYEDITVSVRADGILVDEIPVTGGQEKNGELFYYDQLLSFDIPQNVSTIEVTVNGGYAYMDTFILEGDFGQTVIMVHDACDYLDNSDPLPIIINEGGSYTNTEDRWVDAEEVYTHEIEPMLEIADKYGVGFMVNEFGIFAVNVYWDIDLVAMYHSDILAMLEEHNIGWCYCELYNHVPKHIILLHGSESQWTGATVESQTYCGKEYYVVKELLDVFLEYTK